MFGFRGSWRRYLERIRRLPQGRGGRGRAQGDFKKGRDAPQVRHRHDRQCSAGEGQIAARKGIGPSRGIFRLSFEYRGPILVCRPMPRARAVPRHRSNGSPGEKRQGGGAQLYGREDAAQCRIGPIPQRKNRRVCDQAFVRRSGACAYSAHHSPAKGTQHCAEP